LYAELTQENSDRRKAEEALRASEERWRKLFEYSSVGITVKDLDQRIVAANPAFEEMLGYTKEELQTLTPVDITHEDDCTVTQMILADLKEGRRQADRVEKRFRRKDGSVLWADVSAFFVPATESTQAFFPAIVVDITERKRAEEMQAAMAREREIFAKQRATELAKANEALRGCLDALASVPELDEFLGQVMAAITRQLGAASSTLRVRNIEQNTLPLELVFQNGRVMSPDEVKYPEFWQSVSLQEQRFPFFLDQPAAIIRILDPHSPMPDDYRSYLRELGVKTVLIIPLTSRGQANGRLTFRFTEERDFHPEELEIARALATQASLAIHLTRLAKSARQSAVLEERNQLAAEIHDALAQSFTGITMQLGVAGEQLAAKEGDPLCQIQRANEIAKFGLAEARRSILSLRSSAIQESGLTATLQRLVEHSNVAGRLRCDFRSDNIPEERLPPRIQHELLRFAQEAISNAVRHAKPTVVSVTLRWEPPNLILKVKDNGSGISRASLEKREGFGLSNMRARASQIDGKLDIQTAAGHGTSIVLTVPIPS
jgi:PAS domain S-box-containing protein